MARLQEPHTSRGFPVAALAERAARAPGDHGRAELQRGLMTSVRLPPPASETTKGDSDPLRGSGTTHDHFPPSVAL